MPGLFFPTEMRPHVSSPLAAICANNRGSISDSIMSSAKPATWCYLRAGLVDASRGRHRSYLFPIAADRIQSVTHVCEL